MIPTDERRRGLGRAEVEEIGRTIAYLGRWVGALTVEGRHYRDLWDGGSPLLVYLPQRAVDNARTLHATFARHFAVDVHFAVKSCYLPAIGRALAMAGFGAEVMSGLEWGLAQQLGFPADRIVATAPARIPAHRAEVVAGPGLVSVDSLEELDRVESVAARLGVRPRVLIRVNPLDEDAAFFAAGSKLGADLDVAADLIARALGSPRLRVVGLHAHQLHTCVDVGQFYRMTQRAGEIAAATAPSGRPFPLLDLGGGLEARFLLERAGVRVESFADAARDALSPLGRPPRILLEPGRFVAGDAAIAFTRVLGRKRDWLITEIASNILIPLPDLAYQPVPLECPPEATWQRVHLADATCAPSRLCPDADLPVDDADGLVLLNCGAYTSVFAELWAHALPRIAVFDGSTTTVVFGPDQERAMFAGLYGTEV